MVQLIAIKKDDFLPSEGWRHLSVEECGVAVEPLGPASSERGTYKTVTARFWPWLPGKRP